MSTTSNNQPVKLTKRVVEKAPLPARGQRFIRDSVLKGFGLRLTAGGTRTFIVEKRINGRVRRQTVGRFGELTVEQARKRAQQLLGQIAVGQDPIAEKRRARAQAVTLGQAFEAFLKARKHLKPKTLADYHRAIERDCADWVRKPLRDITKVMIVSRHTKIGETVGQAQANHTLRALRAVLNFARRLYDTGDGQILLPENPVTALKGNWYRVERRRNVIKPYQLPAWYAAVQSLKSPESPDTARVVADFLVFVLFTGMRFNEAARLRWSHVDLQDETVYIADPKNREPFTLPLSDFLVALLKERHAYALNEYVFPGRDGIGPLVEPKRQLDHVRERSGVTFIVHDLRRTFVTVANSLNISPYNVKRLVNHKMSQDITDTYNMPDVETLRATMQTITNYLIKQTKPRKPADVIPLPLTTSKQPAKG